MCDGKLLFRYCGVENLLNTQNVNIAGMSNKVVSIVVSNFSSVSSIALARMMKVALTVAMIGYLHVSKMPYLFILKLKRLRIDENSISNICPLDRASYR